MPAGSHLLTHCMNERQRPGDVGVDHVTGVIEALIQKRATQTVPRIGQQGLHRAAGEHGQKLRDTVGSCKVGFHRLDAHTE